MPIKNTLTDLNDHLFAQMERLDDEDLTAEDLEKEIARSKAMTNVAQTIINNGELILSAQQQIDDYGAGKTGLTRILGITTK